MTTEASTPAAPVTEPESEMKTSETAAPVTKKAAPKKKKAAPKKAAPKKAAPKKAAPKKATTKGPQLPKGINPGVQMIPLTLIDVREGANPRLEFDKKNIEQLAAAMKVQGLLEPIAVAPREEDGLLELIYGERRFRAAKLLKWKDIRADVIVGKSREDHFVMRMQENMQRTDLNAYELARGMQGYITAKNCKAKDAAAVFGVTPGYLSQRLKILKMPSELQLALSKNEINFTQARELARMSPGEQVNALNKIAKGETVRTQDITYAVEESAAKKRANNEDTDGKPRGRPARTKENAPDIARQNLDRAIEALNAFAIEAKPKTQMRDGLVTLYERFTNCRSDTKKEQLRGAVKTLEWALGIRDDF